MMAHRVRRFALATGVALAGVANLAGCAALQPPRLAAAEPGAAAVLDRFAGNRCNPVVARALAGAQIPIAQVDGLTYGLYRDINTGRIILYDAWVYRTGEPGAVIVQLDPTCAVRQVYARGGAMLPQAAKP